MKTSIGEILMRQGKVRHDQIEFLAQLQRAYEAAGKKHMLGDLLVRHRALSLLEVTEALVYQESVPNDPITKIVSAIKQFPKFSWRSNL